MVVTPDSHIPDTIGCVDYTYRRLRLGPLYLRIVLMADILFRCKAEVLGLRCI